MVAIQNIEVNEDKRMNSVFKAGDVVKGEFPSLEGSFNIAPHYLVILGAYPKGVLAMFTTSLKGRSGGVHQFTPAECSQAGFNKACRFDPGRIAFYQKEDLYCLRKAGGTVNEKTLDRMIKAAQALQTRFVMFTPSERVQAKVA